MDGKIYIPPIKIQGIKSKIVPFIRENAPIDRETVWIEPFMGSGVVGFNLEPEQAVFSDLNPYIIDFYNQIKAGRICAAVVRGFLEEEGGKLSRYGEDYYYEVRERFNREHGALDFLFLNRSCFNGIIRFNREKRFNVPFGHKPDRFAKAYITKISNQVRHLETLLSRYDWSFRCQPFEQAFAAVSEHSFIYCDPPYIGRHSDYYDSWDETQEYRLYECLTASQKRFMLSTWDHNQYRRNEYLDHVWACCHKIEIPHFYYVGAREKNRASIVEALLTNYMIENPAINLIHGREK